MTQNATFEEIKESYKSLVLSSHPDRNSSEGSAEKFVLIREAWEILSDSEARICYDKYLGEQRYRRIEVLTNPFFTLNCFFVYQQSRVGTSS